MRYLIPLDSRSEGQVFINSAHVKMLRKASGANTRIEFDNNHSIEVTGTLAEIRDKLGSVGD
jgi:competence transcription factor ComK